MNVEDARIMYVYADNAADKFYCSNWLCAFPAHALDRAGYNVGMISVDEFVHKDYDADLFIVERLLWNGTSVISDEIPNGLTRRKIERFAKLRVIDKIWETKERGRKVAAIFDDHYEAYPRDTEVFEGAELWLDGMLGGYPLGFTPINDFKIGLNVVDAVFSPSRYLLEHYVEDLGKAFLVRNRPILDMWQNPEPHLTSHPIRVGWSGTSQHLVSWRDNPILDALEKLKDEIVLVGATSSRRIAELLRSRGVTFDNSGTVQFNDFPGVVDSYDIGVCPLATEYDKGRSWIKWLECSLVGVPVVAEDFGVYDECQGGYLVDSEKSWYIALARLTDDEAERRRLSMEGRRWAWQQGWDENLQELIEIFDRVIND